MSGCADFWEWFCDLVIRSEEADPFDEEGEALPVARTSNLSSDQGRFKRERMKQLFNRHGYNLAVFPGGNIKGKSCYKCARWHNYYFPKGHLKWWITLC